MENIKIKSCCVFCFAALLMCLQSFAFGEQKKSWRDQFIDPNDGMFDMSSWLREDHGFIPAPIMITDPAVGYGFGTALVFLHDNDGSRKRHNTLLPPSFSGVVGLYTENESWAGGLFHFASWMQDSIRYTGAVGKASVNLEFYGRDSNRFSRGFDYNIQGLYTLHELLFRLPDTKLFLGGRFTYLDAETEFDLRLPIPGVRNWKIDFSSIGIGPVAKYYDLDNLFTPNRGCQIDFESMFFTEDVASSKHHYNISKAAGKLYYPVMDNTVLGWRLDGRFSSGDVPFYALPYVDIRGIPALRYQGDNAGVTEVELRHNLTDRWAVVGFGGVGKTAEDFGDFFSGSSHGAGGAGFRYLMTKDYGIYSGVDIARGPEEWVIYFQFGSAWMR